MTDYVYTRDGSNDLCTLLALNYKLPKNEQFRGITNDMNPSPKLLELLGAEGPVIDLNDGDVQTRKGAKVGDEWRVEYRDFTAAEVLRSEISWVTQELEWADEEVKKHDDNHGRVTANPAAMSTYRNALRDYIRDSKTPNPHIEGLKPTARPGS
jgi:hypothetical protein